MATPDQRILSRREFLKIGVTISGSLVLAGCAPPTEPTQPSSSTPTTGVEQPLTSAPPTKARPTATSKPTEEPPAPIPYAEVPIPNGTEYPSYKVILNSGATGFGSELPQALLTSVSYSEGMRNVDIKLANHSIDPFDIQLNAITNQQQVDGNKFRWILTATDIKTGEFLWIKDQDHKFSDKPLQNPGSGKEYTFVRIPAAPNGFTQQIEWYGEWPVLVRRNKGGTAISLFNQTIGEWVYTPEMSTDIQGLVTREYLEKTGQSDLSSVLEAFKQNPAYVKQNTDGLYGINLEPDKYNSLIYHCPSLLLGMQHFSMENMAGSQPGDVGVRLLFTTTDDFLDPQSTIDPTTGKNYYMYGVQVGILRKGELIPFTVLQDMTGTYTQLESTETMKSLIEQEFNAIKNGSVIDAHVWRPNILVMYDNKDFSENWFWDVNWDTVKKLQKDPQGYVIRNTITKNVGGKENLKRINLRDILQSLSSSESGLYAGLIWVQ